jgi:hypothetical protein
VRVNRITSLLLSLTYSGPMTTKIENYNTLEHAANCMALAHSIRFQNDTVENSEKLCSN